MIKETAMRLLPLVIMSVTLALDGCAVSEHWVKLAARSITALNYAPLLPASEPPHRWN
jgi:hypothetical protein